MKSVINDVKEGFKQVLNDLKKHDRIGLITVSSHVHDDYFFGLPKEKINRDKLDKQLHTITADGQTAFFDCLKQVIQKLKKPRCMKTLKDTTVVEVLVLTDGVDNRSKTTEEEIMSLVAHPQVPNFNLGIVASGMSESDSQKYKKLCNKCKHAHFMPIQHASNAIKESFRQVKQNLEISKAQRVAVRDEHGNMTAEQKRIQCGDNSTLTVDNISNPLAEDIGELSLASSSQAQNQLPAGRGQRQRQRPADRSRM